TAETVDRGELRLRRVLGDDDRRGDAAEARRPGDTLRHVAGARGQDAAGELVVRGLQDRVAGAADLERVHRLQRLELEVDLRIRVDLEADDRRPHGHAGEDLARAADLVEG